MAIASMDDLVNALANNRQKLPFSKVGNLASQTAGGNTSFWMAPGYPLTTTTPLAATVCNNTTPGALPFSNPTGGMKTHLGKLAISTVNASAYELHDRLAHAGGFSTALTTVQSVGIDLSTFSSTSNLAERKGKDDYSQVQWWLEWYVSSGSTSRTATVTYTNQTGTTRTVVVTLPSSMAAYRMLPIIPTTGGDYIRSVTSVQLNGTTGIAGNFGVVATVQRTEAVALAVNQISIMDWAALGLTVIYDSSCLFWVGIAPSAICYPPSGAVTLIQG